MAGLETREEQVIYWSNQAAVKLVGRKIVRVGYLSQKEMDGLGWFGASIVLQLDDGSLLYPSQDDEGNGPGALFTEYEDLPVIPVI